MTSDNPYQSPQPEATTSPKILVGTIATVFGTALVGGLLGLGLGAVIGSMMPGYYRSVFAGGDEPHFDPLAVGMGQGFAQGIAFGGVVGLILVAMFYRHRTRLRLNRP